LSLQHSNAPTFQRSNIPTFQHSNIPTLQHSNTPTLQHSNTPTLQHLPLINPTIKIQRIIAALSVLLFAGKLWAWYLTGSVTILTDALESTVNVVAGFVGLYAVTLAARPRDVNHPYGHGKAEYLSAAVEGTLIIAAGLMVIYQAIFHFLHPMPLQSLDWGMALVSITGVANYFLGVYAVNTGIAHRSATVEAAGRHLKTDAYNTIAIIAGLMAVRFTGWVWLDPLAALVFAVIILFTGYKVLRKSLSGIMDEADLSLLQRVIDVLNKHRRDDWIDLHNMRVMHYGNTLHVDAHMTLPYYFQVQDADREIHALEALIMEHFGSSVELFVHIDGCVFYQCKLCSMPECPVRQSPLIQRLTWDVGNVMLDSKHGKEAV
jgi:cation diffusion facilitator family transporter